MESRIWSQTLQFILACWYMTAKKLLCAALFISTLTGATTQTPSGFSTGDVPRLNGPIRLDGIAEGAWDDIAPLPMTMYQPDYGGALTERTDIRVAHDDRYVYVLARMYDASPEGPLSSTLYRDGGSTADDYLNVIIDPFNDNENALWFYTTPAGIRGDTALSVDGDVRQPSWDGFWDVVTTVNDDGWVAEMRIPFSTLGFQSDAGATTMGIAVSRVIARKNERHVFPDVAPTRERAYSRPSTFMDVTLQDVEADRPVYITPYVRGGVETTTVLGDVGLDVRYNVTSNLIADLTVNTDFAQVEADDQQINLNRFSLFFPEKRSFFQERAGMFEYSLSFVDRLFHSRQVGLVDGEPVQIYGGGRLVGRIGSLDVGAMSLQTAATGSHPSENFSVVRARRRVLNANSYAGGMLTSRMGEDGSYNIAVALDGVFRVVGDEYLTLRAAQVMDDELTSSLGRGFLRNGFAQIMWQRRKADGFNYMMWLTRWEEDFAPKMGFFRLTDFTQSLVRMAYNWLPGQQSQWRRIELALFENLSFDNASSLVETGVWGTALALESKSGVALNLEAVGKFERLDTELQLPDGAFVPAGAHTFYSVWASALSRSGRRLRYGSEMEYGQFFDGTRFNVHGGPVWNPNKHLELDVTWIYNRVRFNDRDQGFDSHILRLKASTAVNSKLSTSALVQLNTAADVVSLNVRARYNFRERSDLWIVYNEGLNSERDLGDIRLPLSQGRLIQFKYTYTLAR